MFTVATVADAIVSELNAAHFSMEFSAVRAFRPAYDIAELEALRVTVVPRTYEINPISRGSDTWQYTVEIGLQKRIEADADVEELLALVEEIANWFRHRQLMACPNLSWSGIKIDPAYAPEHLDECKVFTSVLTLTYREVR